MLCYKKAVWDVESGECSTYLNKQGFGIMDRFMMQTFKVNFADKYMNQNLSHINKSSLKKNQITFYLQ